MPGRYDEADPIMTRLLGYGEPARLSKSTLIVGTASRVAGFSSAPAFTFAFCLELNLVFAFSVILGLQNVRSDHSHNERQIPSHSG